MEMYDLCKTNVNKKNISQNYFRRFLQLLLLFLHKDLKITFWYKDNDILIRYGKDGSRGKIPHFENEYLCNSTYNIGNVMILISKAISMR